MRKWAVTLALHLAVVAGVVASCAFVIVTMREYSRASSTYQRAHREAMKDLYDRHERGDFANLPAWEENSPRSKRRHAAGGSGGATPGGRPP